MKLAIGGMVLTAAWAGNSSAAALEEKWKDGPITIQMEGYAPNSWRFAKLGHIEGVASQELKEILGWGDVTATRSLDWTAQKGVWSNHDEELSGDGPGICRARGTLRL